MKVGVPTLLTRLVKAQLERILLVWVVSLATLTLCLLLPHLIQTDGAFIVLAVNAAGLSFVFCKLIYSSGKRASYRALFIHLNLAVFISMAIVVIDRALSFHQ